MVTTNIENILEQLQNINTNNVEEYESAVSSLAKTADVSTDDLEQVLNSIVADKDKINLAYGLFFLIVTKHRYNNNYNKIEDLDRRYNVYFKDQLTYNHIMLIYKLEKGDLENPFATIKLAYANAKKLSTIGASHLYGDIVATMCEISDENTVQEIKRKWLPQALEEVEKVIDKNPNYAKYYCTRGRLNSINGEHQQAYSDISRAIDIEDFKRKDYAIRMADYMRHKNQIIFNKRTQELNKLVDECNQKLDSSVTGNLEFLGLFAGVISFVIGSIQIASGQSFRDAAALIVVLMGALISAFSVFGVVIGNQTKKKIIINATAFLMGLIIILGGIFIV